MTKPSKRTKSVSRRKTAAKRKPAAPKPVDVVTTAPGSEPPVAPETQDPSAVPAEVVETSPEAELAELKQEIAKFDGDGDGHIGGSRPHHAEQDPDAGAAEAAEAAEVTETVEAPAEAVEEAETAEVAEDAEPEVAEPEAPVADEPADQGQAAPAAVAPFDKCMVGPVEARVGRVPLSAVLGLLSPDGLRRVEAEKSTASFESTCKRLLASDGRAAPVVFSQDHDATVMPSILHGYQEIAAAEASGANEVTVILIPPGGASEAQSHIVEMVRQRQGDQPSNDDELFYRVHAEG